MTDVQVGTFHIIVNVENCFCGNHYTLFQNYLINRKFKRLNDNLWTQQTWDTLFLHCQF